MERELNRGVPTTKELHAAVELDRAALSKGGQPVAADIQPGRRNDNGNTELAALPPATPLVEASVAQDFQGRWNAIQVSFVDEPRQAVEQADNLVAETVKR